jgi:hypothetical protein
MKSIKKVAKPTSNNKRKAVYPPKLTPGAKEDDGSFDYQQILKVDGVVVVPTPLTNQTLREQARAEMIQHYCESPEFAKPMPEDPEDPTWTPQLGGFAANGNPSSFHHPWVRGMREKLMAVILDTDALPTEGRNLEQCFDRLLYRTPGKSPTAETMHRDEALFALDKDVVFGGWVNFDNEPQTFSCCPRTHKMVSTNKGFAKIAQDNYEYYRRPNPKEGRPDGWVNIEIPPGACLIFYERLVHEVVSTKVDRVMMRMFLGWRVTDVKTPLFGIHQTEQWICDQGVPKIKSGQDPPVWPSAYSNFSRNFPILTMWSERTYVPACLYKSTVGGDGPSAGTTWIRVKAKMLSLKQYGLPMHPAYDVDEKAILFPQQAWNLYTFNSPLVRVTYQGVTMSTWDAYLATKKCISLGMVARRPRPEVLPVC